MLTGFIPKYGLEWSLFYVRQILYYKGFKYIEIEFAGTIILVHLLHVSTLYRVSLKQVSHYNKEKYESERF